MITYETILESKNYIDSFGGFKPQIGIILGSGLSSFADSLNDKLVIPYKDIPNFPISTVKGHKGNLVLGTLEGKNIICMQGRFHFYEGYSMQEVTFPIRVMQLLGIKILIITNAAGGVNKSFSTGDIMIITDHISRMPNPLIGPNDERLGTRFPSTSEVYDKELINIVKAVAKKENIDIKQGVYVGNTGPSFETNAEYIMFRNLGISAVGMSTVPEVIVAAHGGMKVLGLSVISNVFDENAIEEPSHQEVLDNVERANSNLLRLIEGVLQQI
ncbi:MAG: purine-nucleoside phosphorylase [Bacteroidota bacterium]|nr:purine-nucleoside phosphorylase [Bacteroidota bacterium]